MARPKRIHFAGALYHVISRGNAGQPTFLCEADYRSFLDSLVRLKPKLKFKLYTYCLMPNHFHLLVGVGEAPLWTIMQRLLVRFTRLFNDRHRRYGHVFQGRFKAFLCNHDPYFATLVRYIHQNPVRAKLAAEPGAWPWSGHNSFLGKDNAGLVDSELPLSMFGAQPTQARAEYLRFLAADRQAAREDAFYRSVPPPKKTGEGIPIAFPQRQAHSPDELEAVAGSVGQEICIPVHLIRSRCKNPSIVAARKLFVVRACATGFRQTDIASYLGCSPSLVSWLKQ